MIWHVPAVDALGRERDIVIEASPGHVAVVYPPGEGVGLTPDQADALAFTLQAAANWARGLGATSRHVSGS